jgi:hypothetical protein
MEVETDIESKISFKKIKFFLIFFISGKNGF